MKRLFPILLTIILFSCKEKFNPNEFKGSWISLDSDESFNEILPTFTFKSDSIYIEEIYTYSLKGKYKLTSNCITLYLKNDTLKYRFKYNSKDSVIFIENNKYYHYPGFTSESNFLDYELLNLNREKKITSDSLSKFDNGIHLFKDINDSLRLKLNDKITSDFELIPHFVIRSDRYQSSGSVIYLDKKIALQELIKLYAKLWQVNRLSNLLITDFDIKTNSYSGFRDRIELWKEQIELFSKESLEPIRPKIFSRNQYLKKYAPKIIKINSKNDFKILEDITKDKNYLIQINTDMDLESYILLKERVREIKRIQKTVIKTEFSMNLQD